MRVLLFEAGTGGHAFNYHRLLLPALASLANEIVVIVGQNALSTPAARVQLAGMPGDIHWDESLPPMTGPHVKRQFIARKTLLRALARHRPDHIYVPTADHISQMLGLASLLGRQDLPTGVEAEGVLHRCGFAYPANSRLTAAFYRAGYWTHARAPWTRLFNVDLIAYEWIQRHAVQFAERNYLLPDPIEAPAPITRDDARRSIGLPTDGQLIGCVGEINERKGIDLLLPAFRGAKVPSTVRLLLAGKHHPSINAKLQSDYADLVRAGRIISIDRYLGVEELHHALFSLDLVCTPYRRQLAIASIVLRAAAADRPVLAANIGWCGRMVPLFSLGWTCNAFDPDEFAEAIASSLQRASDWRPSAPSLRLREFHTPENFIAIFTERLRERLGLPSSSRKICWNNVQPAMSPSN